MAEKIRGITIEISADTNPVMKAFKEMDSSLKETDKSLKDVNKLLKFDSSNVTLLSQKQEYLNEAISKARLSLKYQQDLLANMPTDSTGKLTEEQKALARNIEATQQRLSGYETQLKDTQSKLAGASNETDNLKEKTKDAGKSFDEAGKKASTFGEVLKANLSADAIKGIANGVMNLGKSMFNMGVEAASTADDILTMSTQFGLSTDTIQEFQYMAELTDTSLETVTGSMTKLTKSMQSANEGSKTTSEAFASLGVSVTDANGNLRDNEEVFLDVINALGQMDNETERNAVSMQIFGKSASELNPLIAVGADGLKEYAEEAHQVGYILDQETLGSLGDVDDAMQRAKNSLDAVKTQIGTALAPVVADLTESFVEWAKSVDWKKVGDTIKSVAKGIGTALNTIIPIMGKIISKAIEVVDFIARVFKGEWTLPKIKLPHFAIEPKGWKIGDLLKGIKPKLGIEWYAKGMEGMVLDGATIFGMNRNGQLMAGGEAGREVIIGEKNLMNAIQNMHGSGTTINVVVNESVNAQQTARYVINEIQYQLATEGGAWR